MQDTHRWLHIWYDEFIILYLKQWQCTVIKKELQSNLKYIPEFKIQVSLTTIICVLKKSIVVQNISCSECNYLASLVNHFSNNFLRSISRNLILLKQIIWNRSQNKVILNIDTHIYDIWYMICNTHLLSTN